MTSRAATAPKPQDGEHKGLLALAFGPAESWDKWLDENGAAVAGIWLKFAKKSAGVTSVSKAAAIERALGANRCAILHRIHDARQAKARAARIGKFVAMLARGETVHG